MFLAIKRDQLGLEALPDWLAILQLAYMQYPLQTSKEDFHLEVQVLIKACRDGKLHYQGDINGWSWPRHKENPYLSYENNIAVPFFAHVHYYLETDFFVKRGSSCCWIHKTDFKHYKESIGKWPLQVEGLRESYWDDDEQEAETLVDAGADNTALESREGGYWERDNFAIELIKKRPELLKLRRGGIKAELQKASDFFKNGRFNDWWRKQKIFPKGKGGRNQNS